MRLITLRAIVLGINRQVILTISVTFSLTTTLKGTDKRCAR